MGVRNLRMDGNGYEWAAVGEDIWWWVKTKLVRPCRGRMDDVVLESLETA